MSNDNLRASRLAKREILDSYHLTEKSVRSNLGHLGLTPPVSSVFKYDGARHIWAKDQVPSFYDLPSDRQDKIQQFQSNTLGTEQCKIKDLSIRCFVGDQQDLVHLPSEYLYKIHREDVRQASLLSEMNLLGVKVVNFVQATWPREYLEAVNAIRPLTDCINNQEFFRTMTHETFSQHLRIAPRTTNEMIGYRYWFFDLDQPTTLNNLLQQVESFKLTPFLFNVVESSEGKFHLYFKAPLSETAHWDLTKPVDRSTHDRRIEYRSLWRKLKQLFNADVGEQLIQKAQTPGYLNPKNGFVTRIAFTNPDAQTLNLQTARQLTEGIFGIDQPNPIQLKAQEDYHQRNPLSIPNKLQGVVPTLNQYLELYHAHQELESLTSINDKIKLLTTHLLDHIDHPFPHSELESYFQSVIQPAFINPTPQEERKIFSQWQGWVKYHSKHAAKILNIKRQRMRQPDYEENLDLFLQQFLKAVIKQQFEKPFQTIGQHAKMPQYIKQVKIALMDPTAKCVIDFDQERLVGSIPCKYLKGAENGLGRYNELTRSLEEGGFIQRSFSYVRPHIKDGNWCGECRTWKLFLTPQEPKVLNKIFGRSIFDYFQWLNVKGPPVWWQEFHFQMKKEKLEV